MSDFTTQFVFVSGAVAAWRMFVDTIDPRGMEGSYALVDALAIGLNCGLAFWAGLILFG